MLKIEVDDEGQRTVHQGDPVSIAAEVGMVIAAIYNNFKKVSPMAADTFQGCVRELVNSEDSPIWGPVEGVTTITKAKNGSEQKGGAPTGQS